MHATSTRSPAAVVRAVAVGSIAVTIVLLAFLWPGYNSEPKDLPVALSAPAAQAAQLTENLEGSGIFTISEVADRDAAVAAIEQREAYGAFVATENGVEVLTATAASPAAAQALSAAAQQVQGALDAAFAQAQQANPAIPDSAAPTVEVTDIVPLSPDDPRGTNLALVALPLAMGGMIGGAVISLLVSGRAQRLAGVLGYGLLAGLLLALILGPWLGILVGSFWMEWLILAVALVGTAAVIVGLHGLIGYAGIGIGAVLTLFIGNPLSSAAAPVEFLPWHWGTIGQYFIPGAGSTLLRLESYFPAASTAGPWLVLLAWAVVGLALISVRRHGTDTQSPSSVEDSQAAREPAATLA